MGMLDQLTGPQVWRPPADPYALTGAQQVGAALPGVVGNQIMQAGRGALDALLAPADVMEGRASLSDTSTVDRMIALGGMMVAPVGRTGVGVAGTGASILDETEAQRIARVSSHWMSEASGDPNLAYAQYEHFAQQAGVPKRKQTGVLGALQSNIEAQPPSYPFDRSNFTDSGEMTASELPGTVRDVNPNGLPTDQASRYARAQQMGFDTSTPLYHGTLQPWQGEGFLDPAGRPEAATFLSPDPNVANAYALGEAGQVLPVFARMSNPLVKDFGGARQNSALFSDMIDQARSGGYDGIVAQNVRDSYATPENYYHKPSTQVMVFDPSNLRSTSAIFDPAASGSSDLLRTGGGIPLYQLPSGPVVDANGVPQT